MARGRVRPFRFGDCGAVTVEFALLLPVQVLMFVGVFGMGAVMIESEQLNFVTQGAAKLEAATPGTGVPWASAQLPPPAQFAASACNGGAQITGQWPITLGIFPPLTLSAQACWPQ